MTQKWPPTLLQNQPVILEFDTKNLNFYCQSLTKTNFGKIGENIVANLYARSSWTVVARNIRIRGSEIDLVVKNKCLKEIKIIEVKTRHSNISDVSFAENLIPAKKLASLKFGARQLMQNLPLEDQNLNWSLDVVVLSPTQVRNRLCLTTWVNAFDLN